MEGRVEGRYTDESELTLVIAITASDSTVHLRGLHLRSKEATALEEAVLAEIGRLDGELEAARETVQQGREVLEAERQAHEQTKSDARQAQAVADERDKRIAALEAELRGEREARAASDQALTALRVDAATLTERAAHVDELRQVLRSLQEGKGSRRGSKPEEGVGQGRVETAG